MKTAVRTQRTSTNVYRHYRRPYPNAADPQYFLNRLVDYMLAIAAGMGSITVFLYLVIL